MVREARGTAVERGRTGDGTPESGELPSETVTSGRVTLCFAVALGLLVACSDDSPEATPTTETTSSTTTSTAPERPVSTTTTAFDPASVEGAVEAAYLKSWDVYADAVYDLVLDEDALAEVYAEESLSGKVEEIEGRIADGRAAHVVVDHEYDVVMVDSTTAHVVDRFVNHQVLIDPTTKEPVEKDPNEKLVFNFTVCLGDDGWRVTYIERVNL
jgi:hypothetical protein